RQSSGEGPRHRQGRDHIDEPRLRGGPRDVAAGSGGDARVPLRRFQRGLAAARQARVLAAGPPRRFPGNAPQPLSIRAVHRSDEGAQRTLARGAGSSRMQPLHSAPTLETERLILRPPIPDDLEAWVAFCADPEVTRFLGGVLDRAGAWRNMSVMAGA